MSTQHPDNVTLPFFSQEGELQGEDEVREAYYAFSQLCCDEQLWDCEGKEIDNYVVKKLLSRHPELFRDKRLGRDLRITLRVPNPELEKAEAKILLETLESIPRSYDAASLFYSSMGDDRDIAPIFEVIQPMTTSSLSIDQIHRYYREFVAGKQDKLLGDTLIARWIGNFSPAEINVIPLFEDKETMLISSEIVREYLQDKKVEYQRVFFARSDPALNYGMLSAVLLNKLALADLWDLSQELELPMYPILGVGSAPFRGNLTPLRVEGVLAEYPSVQTFTVQSAFKYDYPTEQVMKGIAALYQHKPSMPQRVDRDRAILLIEKYSAEYQKQVASLAPVINLVAQSVPGRRKRKLHIGLFGYAREGSGVKLPRAITFTAAMYSLGLPPELLALNALDENDLEFLATSFVNFQQDIGDSLRYLNIESPIIPGELKDTLSQWLGRMHGEPDPEHKKITASIAQRILGNNCGDIKDYVVQAAGIRRFLG
jgi:phosphoenolpyruvate carboxylase